MYAFEQKEEGCALIRANAENSRCEKPDRVPGKAPESLPGYPAPDQVFLGGSSGNMTNPGFCDGIKPGSSDRDQCIALESLTQPWHGLPKGLGAGSGLHAGIPCRKARAIPYDAGAESDLCDHGTEPGRECFRAGKSMKAMYRLSQTRPRNFQNLQAQTAQGRPARASWKRPRILLAAPGSGSGKTLLTTGLLTRVSEPRHPVAVPLNAARTTLIPCSTNTFWGLTAAIWTAFSCQKKSCARCFANGQSARNFPFWKVSWDIMTGLAAIPFPPALTRWARITDTPVILVVDGKGSSLSLAAQIKGFLDYQKDSHICGVILIKRTKGGGTPAPEIEKLDVRYLGAVPVCETMDIKSRHLGLTMPEEQSELRGHLDAFAEQLAQCLDVGRNPETGGIFRNRTSGSRKNHPGRRKSNRDSKQESRAGRICVFTRRPPHGRGHG